MSTERLVIWRHKYRPLTCVPTVSGVCVRGHVDLQRLLVLHLSGPLATIGRDASLPDVRAPSGFRLTTCQRQIEILFHAAANPAPTAVASDPRVEWFRGVDAYRFLLEFATGLRSAIPGETNVFGQLRAAWRDYLGGVQPSQRREFSALIETLFADTRAIRTAFLQDIGGHSYGTLTRKLLRPAPAARILIVGHGELARSILAMLAEFELGLINRTRPTAVPEAVQRVFEVDEAETAVDWADHVVLCVPRHPELDARWVTLLATRPALRAVHLGCRRADAGGWAELRELATLDDLFDLRIAQQDRRSRQLQLARAACRARALLRAADSHMVLQLPRGIA